MTRHEALEELRRMLNKETDTRLFCQRKVKRGDGDTGELLHVVSLCKRSEAALQMAIEGLEATHATDTDDAQHQ